MIVLAEQASAQLAVGGQPNTRAVATEWLRYRGDQADFSRGAVSEAIFPRCFAALVRNLLQRPEGVDPAMDFCRGNHLLAAPVSIRIQRHELNEAHDHATFAGEGSEGLLLIAFREFFWRACGDGRKGSDEVEIRLAQRSIEYFKKEGSDIVSLGLAPLSNVHHTDETFVRTSIDFLTHHFGNPDKNRSLFTFKKKFQPQWESRYLVYSHTLTLPTVGWALYRAVIALAAYRRRRVVLDHDGLMHLSAGVPAGVYRVPGLGPGV